MDKVGDVKLSPVHPAPDTVNKTLGQVNAQHRRLVDKFLQSAGLGLQKSQPPREDNN